MIKHSTSAPGPGESGSGVEIGGAGQYSSTGTGGARNIHRELSTAQEEQLYGKVGLCHWPV